MSVSALTPSPISTRPYLLRALYEWCTDNGYTPYIAAYVDDSVQVPREHVKNNEIVLNISMDATSSLKLGNEFIEFKARFSGTARQIMVPINHVIAIYARENGQGMSFPFLQGTSVATPALGQPQPGQPVAAPMPVPVASEAKIKAVPKRATGAASMAGVAGNAGEVASPRVVQLVKATSDDAGNDDSPPPPTTPSPTRPALKRVK